MFPKLCRLSIWEVSVYKESSVWEEESFINLMDRCIGDTEYKEILSKHSIERSILVVLAYSHADSDTCCCS
jgi:hypothetical protein